MKKQNFEVPELKIVTVSASDVIATSGPTAFLGEEDEFTFPG